MGAGLEGLTLGTWSVCFDSVTFTGTSGSVGGADASLGPRGRGGGAFLREGLRSNSEACSNDLCGMGGGFLMGGWLFLEGTGSTKKMEFPVEKFPTKSSFVVYCCAV